MEGPFRNVNALEHSCHTIKNEQRKHHFTRETKINLMKKNFQTRELFAVILIYFVVSGFSLFQPLVRKNDEGNKNYREKNYEEALKSYTDALLESPESPELHYNIGNVMYRNKKYKDAISEFEKSLSTDNTSLQAKTYYNMGNCAFRENEYTKAIEYYKKALEIDPDDEDAKFNLEFTRQKLKEMMQNQQQQQQQQQQMNQENQQQAAQGNQSQENKEGEKGKENNQEKAEAKPSPMAGVTPTPQPADSPNESSTAEEEKSGEKEEGITKEEAMNLLRAMDDYEKENQKEMIRRMMPEREYKVEKDW